MRRFAENTSHIRLGPQPDTCEYCREGRCTHPAHAAKPDVEGEGERFETTVHDKRTGQPVAGCEGDAIARALQAEAERDEARANEAVDLRRILEAAGEQWGFGEADRMRSVIEALLATLPETGGRTLLARAEAAEARLARVEEG